jgi:uracil-DNA glycosylase family 4
MTSKEILYKSMCNEASGCTLCPNVFHKYTYLNENNGNVNSPVMFIGEAPGFVKDPKQRLKAFYGNQSGWNFEHLLNHIGIKRSDVFVTNALLHTPVQASGRKYDDDYGCLSIRPPSIEEVKNCGKFLRAQIDLINPRIICTLGKAAIDACQAIFSDFPHALLRVDVARPMKWDDKVVFPLYHTSPNVTASIRTLRQMEKDFQALGKLMDELGVPV